jgi:cytochrome c-type biogenesis protein CcmH
MNPVDSLAAIFSVLVLLAAFFVVFPVLRAKSQATTLRLVVGGTGVVAVLAIGVGLYVMEGSPSLALRALSAPKDVPSLIAALSQRAREKPFDARGWALLGRGYMSLRDPGDAAAAFRRAIQIAPPDAKPDLLSAFGEAQTVAASGTVTDEAAAAFHAALDLQPKDPAARYYLGLASAQRGDKKGALGFWKPLLDESPPDAPWRSMLLNRVAMLEGQSGQVPDIAAMVAGLAARLKTSPNDPEGWQRLVRAYTVLGEPDKAHAALLDARTALRGNAAALAALQQEAASLKLE